MKKRQWLVCLLVLLHLAALAQDSTTAKGTSTTTAKGTGASPAAPKTSSSAACGPELMLGASIVFEGATPRFTTFGPQAAITFPVSGRIGIMGDAGYYQGSNLGVNYSKFQGMVGVSYMPPESRANKVNISPYLLVGIADVGSKYSYSGYSLSDHSTAPAAALGAMVDIPLNNSLSIGARADFNPTFNHGTQANFRAGGGLVFHLGATKCKVDADLPFLHTQEKAPGECVAPTNTTDTKISLFVIEKVVKEAANIANKTPYVEAKASISPVVAVRRGEECCSKDKPPVTYTELKAGVEGSFEINITIAGMPDIKFEQELWPFLVMGKLQAKLFWGPTGKINLDIAGKFYGDLGQPNPRPDCHWCASMNYKVDCNLRIGGKIGGDFEVYHWSPFGKGEAGFPTDDPPDFEVGVSAELSGSVGATMAGTYGFMDQCDVPPPGLHGKLNIGKVKVNGKFKVKLGRINIDINEELPVWDGIIVKY